MEKEKMENGLQMAKDFFKKVEEDEVLQTKLEEISEGDELEIAPRLIRLGAEYGYHFTETDLGHLSGEMRELEDDDLEMVSGGCNSTTSGLLKIVGQWAKTKCFSANCTVSTPDGEKYIKDIRVGDEVLSLDAEGKKRIAKVTDVTDVREMQVIRVLFENGKEWLTTKSQWFYCGSDNFACVNDPGSKKAVTADGGETGVKSVEETGKTEAVYDFVVDGLNVFFVNGIAAEGFSLS